MCHVNITSLNVVHGGCWGCLLFGRRTLGDSYGLVTAAVVVVVTPHLLTQATGLLLQARMDLAAALSPGNTHVQYKKYAGYFHHNGAQI